ncbi:MAG: kinase/pyrophosphorylase [Alphaproteobacteria bacterium]|nr:kinase/pyrophosphorylase [Alphaproteobacteria bacterium]
MSTNNVHIHLLSDSTGETLENLAKAALAQFEEIDVQRHFWPMVRSSTHLDRVMREISQKPGLVLYTIINRENRDRLENHCRTLGLVAVAALDPIVDALSRFLGQTAKGRPGSQHNLDDAYFSRVDAIHFTIAHDDGAGSENWEQADIILVGISRTSKTPTSIYLANRGLKTANVPLVVESPPPDSLFHLRHPMIVGLITSAERLVQIRRNRLLSLNQMTDTAYVKQDAVNQEIVYARRIFADQNWPVMDMTRRSIEEAAAAIMTLYNERRGIT